MLKKIKVTPLAEESLGVRSICTFVETNDVRILLDAGASLAPTRLGQPPHPSEYRALQWSRKKIEEAAEKADVVTVSHYHFDHHTPAYTDWFTNWCSAEVSKQIYEKKVVLAKSYRSKVNASQRRRGWMFTKTVTNYVKQLESADGRTFEFGKTKVRFSEPVFHGSENSDLGWVIMVTVEVDDERFVFGSDVQGPMYGPTLDKILSERPGMVIVGGPPTYLSGFRVKEENIEQAMQNLKKLVENVPTTILAHHILRDENWKSLCQPIFDAAKSAGTNVVTAAEYLGEENNCLEFRRRQLFKTEHPSSDFKTWMKLPLQERKLVKPPL